MGRIIRIDEDKLTALYDEDGTYKGNAFPLEAVQAAPRAKVVKFSDPWIVVFQPALQRLARGDGDLTYSDVKVLLELLSHADATKPEWEIRSTEMGRALGMDKSRFSACVTALVKAGYIQRTRKGYVTFDPSTAWRGPAAARETALGRSIDE